MAYIPLDENLKNNLEQLNFNQPLSVKTIRNKTIINGKKINKKYLIRSLHHLENYRNVNPLEVGSGKHQLNVWEKV